MRKTLGDNTAHDAGICYLCGEQLAGAVSRDDVPPKQIFPRAIRKRHHLSLLKLPVHPACNQSYMKDEEYFVVTLSPAAGDSLAGKALWEDLSRKFRRPQGRRLGEMVRKEFYPIELPGELAAKTFDGRRVRRVIAKIVRGLFFHEQRRFLPIGTPSRIYILGPHDRRSDELAEILPYVASAESKGRYPGVFDYKYRDQKCDDLLDIGSIHLWFWGMLFWNTLLALTIFHDPECLGSTGDSGEDSCG